MQGSLEALTESLRKLERDEVKLAFVHRGVGGITENDITLAATSNATIIGFNVRPDRKARELAERGRRRDPHLRDHLPGARRHRERHASACSRPEFEEVVTGEAEVREIFSVPRVGAIAGCYVRSGTITRGSKVRFLRDGVDHLEGRHHVAQALQGRRARGAVTGFECGIGLVRLPGPQSRRHHRDVRGTADSSQLIRRRPPRYAAAMFVLAFEVDLHINESRSLKAKRGVIKAILEGARHRYSVAAAEVGVPGPVAARPARLRHGVVVASSRRRRRRRARAVRVVTSRDRGRDHRASVARVTHSQRPPRVYPRTARLNRLLREIVADELERIDDERLEHVAVTGVDVETGIQHATVWFDSYAGPEADDDILAAFAEHRVRLQSAIGRQARVKRTPVALVSSRCRRPYRRTDR